MEKKSKTLLVFVIVALVASVTYSYYQYVWGGYFLIDESQVEADNSDAEASLEESLRENVFVGPEVKEGE